MTDLPEAAAAPRHGGATVRFPATPRFELDLGVATVLTDPVLRHRVLFLRRTATRPAPPRGPRRWCWSPTCTTTTSTCRPWPAGPPGSVMPCREGPSGCSGGTGSPTPCRWAPARSHRVGELTVTATPARHSGGAEPFGPTAEALGYLLEARGHAGLLRRRHRPVPRRCAGWAPLDLALLPVWAGARKLGPGAPGPGAGRGGRRAAAATGRHTHALGQPRGDRPLAAAGPATGAGAGVRGGGAAAGAPTDVRCWRPPHPGST